MPDVHTLGVVGSVFYKLGCLASGTLVCWMGYKLFVKGIWGNAGDLKFEMPKVSIVLQQAAPGSFFAVLGAVIICFTVWHGMTLGTESDTTLGSGSSIGPKTLATSASSSATTAAAPILQTRTSNQEFTSQMHNSDKFQTSQKILTGGPPNQHAVNMSAAPSATTKP